MNLDQIGQYTATVKVKTIDPPGNAKANWVAVEGQTKKLRYWVNAQFGTPLTVGAEAEAVIEVKEENGAKIAWLKSFGGLKGKSVGGGFKSTPKEFYAELAPSIGGIYSHCIDKGLKPEEIEPYAASYAKVMKGIKEKVAS